MYLTKDVIQEKTGLSRSTVYRMWKTGVLELAFRVGREPVFTNESVNRLETYQEVRDLMRES